MSNTPSCILPHQQRHIEDRLERIRQREQEALAWAKSLDPVVIASQGRAEGGGGGEVEKAKKTPQVVLNGAIPATKTLLNTSKQDFDSCQQNGVSNGYVAGD